MPVAGVGDRHRGLACAGHFTHATMAAMAAMAAVAAMAALPLTLLLPCRAREANFPDGSVAEHISAHLGYPTFSLVITPARQGSELLNEDCAY